MRVSHTASLDDRTKVDLHLHCGRGIGEEVDVGLLALCWTCYNEPRRIAKVQRCPITKVLAEFVAPGPMNPIRMSFLAKAR